MKRSTELSASSDSYPVRNQRQRQRRNTTRRWKSAFVAGAIAVLMTGSASDLAWGDSPTEDLLSDRFVVSAGGFLLSSTTSARLLGSANTSDRTIDFDKQFGTDANQRRLRADVLWRITPTQHLRFSYFDNDTTGTRPIGQDLPWGDYTFRSGGQVTAETKSRIYQLDYEYAFLRRPNYQIAAIAGIHYEKLTLNLSGNASLTVDTPTGPVEQPPITTTRSSSVPAPLPVFGLRGDWAVSRHVYLDASGQIFSVSYHGISGNWSDLRAGASWMFSDHFGVGIGYDRWVTHVDVGKASFNGRLNFGYQGLLLYFRGGF